MSEAAHQPDGETHDQGSDGSEHGVDGGGSDDRYQRLEAQMGLVQDGLNEIRSALLQRSPATQQAVEEDLEDDEPVTAKKVSRIVKSSIATAVNQSTYQQQRREWDNRAKSEFPVTDPVFQRKLKQIWNEQVESGMDPNHPKAAYNVAKITSEILGSKKPAKKDPETAHTAEPPTSASRQTRVPASSRADMVDENDPRIRLYNMQGNKSKEKIESFRKKLAEQDAKKRSRA